MLNYRTPAQRQRTAPPPPSITVPAVVDRRIERLEAAVVARDRKIAALERRIDALLEWVDVVEDWALQAVRHADRVAGIR